MEPARTLVEIRGLVKTREKGGVVFTISVPQLSLRAGEFVVLCGPSGCGKSTLLDMLGLVLPPDTVTAFHLDIGRAEPLALAQLSGSGLAAVRRQEIGYVLQSGGLLPFLTVRRNIELPLLLNGSRRPRQEAERLASLLGIADQLGKKPAYLSGGQRQRTAIARALAHGPRLVLADEPTAAVDRLSAREILAEFKELTRRFGTTLVMASHQVDLVKGLADRMLSFNLAKPSPLTTEAVLTQVDGGNGP